GASCNPPLPVTRSLQKHLEALFNALLKQNTEPTLILQVEITYEYTINATLDPVPLPILMQAPLTVNVQAIENNNITLAQMIIDWSAAIELWFSTYRPQPVDAKDDPGTLWLDLVIMSNLTKQPRP